MAIEPTHVIVPGCGCISADEGCSVCDAPIEIYRMVCGVECVAFPDGTLAPEIDFYYPSARDKATCEKCKNGAPDEGSVERIAAEATT